jgi:NADH:ubiquinone oxidoreductase subunit 3 (subunit A)
LTVAAVVVVVVVAVAVNNEVLVESQGHHVLKGDKLYKYNSGTDAARTADKTKTASACTNTE